MSICNQDSKANEPSDQNVKATKASQDQDTIVGGDESMGWLSEAISGVDDIFGGFPGALPSIVYRPLTVSYIPPNVTRPWGVYKKQDSESRNSAPKAWPQRLLHVQSMTSFGRCEGDCYGGRTRPSYNALSYSWGQFRVLPGRKRGKRSSRVFQINGLPPGWPITPVLLSHYTPEDLDQVVSLCVGQPPSELVGSGHEQEFLWLDQAGVDQRDVSPRNTELRRQGLIFQNARHSFVWFTKLDTDSLTTICNGLPAAAREAQKVHLEHTYSTSWISTTTSLVLDLVTDPWFRGLWTLQEAFFSADSFLVSREAKLIEVFSDQGRQAATLRTLTDACYTILRCCQEYLHPNRSLPTDISEAVRKCVQILKISGLATLAFPHPINFYSAARYRITTAGDLDYLEAITQIFGVELDSQLYGEKRAANPVCAGEMEVRIGALMFENESVRSQLHCFTSPVAAGSGWRFNGSSQVPFFPGGLRSIMESAVETFCTFSVKVAQGQYWGGLSGMACKAVGLNDHLTRISDQRLTPALLVALDSQEIGGGPPYPQDLPCFFTFDESFHFDTSSHFSNLSHEMIVFHLGRITFNSADQFDPGPEKRLLEAGLLLVPLRGHAAQCWRRVGCCLWNMLEGTKHEDRGLWEPLSGIFG